MALFLVQHGKNLSKNQDPQKGISPEGADEVRRIAQVARGYNARVSTIVHSGKKRALQTARILSDILEPANGLMAVDGIAPLDDAVAYAETLDLAANMMIVGHLPFLERLMSVLVIKQAEPPVFQMQNGGIVCLDRYRQTRQVSVQWALMPHVD